MFNHADLFLNKYKRPVVYPAKIHAARKRPDGDDVVTLRKRPKADQFALGIIQSQVQGRCPALSALGSFTRSIDPIRLIENPEFRAIERAPNKSMTPVVGETVDVTVAGL